MLGQDSVQCHQKGGKGEEKRTAETECALASEEQKDCRLGRNAVGVLLASREVQGRIILLKKTSVRPSTSFSADTDTPIFLLSIEYDTDTIPIF